MFQIIPTLALELPSFLMCSWTVNHGVIWTIVRDIVLVGLLIARQLMYMS